MKKLTALSATLLVAAMSALAAPVYAQSHHDGRGGDRHDARWGDHDRGGRYDRRDDRRGDDRRYEDRRYDGRGNAPRVYRAPRVYVAPRGYAVQRWHVGTRMPPPFYASTYYVDPYAYQLRLPPRGYHWVRVDRDAYMVSIASGIVADVLYGIFR